MAPKIWLLVEWVDERNVFASYGVVNMDPLANDVTALRPGKLIFTRVNHEKPRRAKILRISESKRYVKEQKEILERQDQKVQKVLRLCMRSIKKLKSDSSFNARLLQTHSHRLVPHVVVAQLDNSETDDSDSEHNVQINRKKPRKSSKSKPKYTAQYKRKKTIGKQKRGSLNANKSRQQSIISNSTPLPTSRAQQNIRLRFDQGTQTEGSLDSKIEEMEAQLKKLYRRFQFLVSQVNSNGSKSMSKSKLNVKGVNTAPNVEDSCIDPNNTADNRQVRVEREVGAEEEVVEDNGGEPPNPNALHVRRMSAAAQTTNNRENVINVELVIVMSVVF